MGYTLSLGHGAAMLAVRALTQRRTWTERRFIARLRHLLRPFVTRQGHCDADPVARNGAGVEPSDLVLRLRQMCSPIQYGVSENAP